LADLKRIYNVDPKVDNKLAEKIRVGVIWTFGQIGPEAAETVPLILAAFQDRNNTQTLRIVSLDALGKIGPKARSAIPTLEKLLASEDESLRAIIRSAVEKIRQ
jgi:HEAT repeat protein